MPLLLLPCLVWSLCLHPFRGYKRTHSLCIDFRIIFVSRSIYLKEEEEDEEGYQECFHSFLLSFTLIPPKASILSISLIHCVFCCCCGGAPPKAHNGYVLRGAYLFIADSPQKSTRPTSRIYSKRVRESKSASSSSSPPQLHHIRSRGAFSYLHGRLFFVDDDDVE